LILLVGLTSTVPKGIFRYLP